MYEFMYENGLHLWLSEKILNCVFQAVELKLFSHQNYSLSLARNLIISGFGSHNLVFFDRFVKKKRWISTKIYENFMVFDVFLGSFLPVSYIRTWILWFQIMYESTCTWEQSEKTHVQCTLKTLKLENLCTNVRNG